MFLDYEKTMKKTQDIQDLVRSPWIDDLLSGTSIPWDSTGINDWTSEEQALSYLSLFDEHIIDYNLKSVALSSSINICDEEQSAMDYLFYNYGWGFRQGD